MSFSFHRFALADLPHADFQLVVSPQRGLTGQCLGYFQAIQSTLGKEGIRPAMMITAPTTTSLVLAVSQ